MCLQVRDALTVGSISLSAHFFSVKMDVKDALKALGNEMRCAMPAFLFLRGHALTAVRLYSGYAILVEPPKTTFGKVRREFCSQTTRAVANPAPRNRCAKPTREKSAASKTTPASRCSSQSPDCAVSTPQNGAALAPTNHRHRTLLTPGSRNRYERFRRTNRGMTA